MVKGQTARLTRSQLGMAAALWVHSVIDVVVGGLRELVAAGAEQLTVMGTYRVCGK
jgi:hypothetical protein